MAGPFDTIMGSGALPARSADAHAPLGIAVPANSAGFAPHERDDLDWYLRHVLPFAAPGEDGRICIAVQKGTGFAQFATQTIAEAKQAVHAVSGNPSTMGMFVAQARMRGKRDAENAMAFSSVWIDLDAKKVQQPGDDQATAKQRAFDKLSEFVGAAGLPPPSVTVDSGGGVHGYWLFDAPIDKEPWRKIAKALHACMRHHGLPADVACTIDAARILRIPGTYNRKPEYGTPRLVKVISPPAGDPIRYAADVIADALANHIKQGVSQNTARHTADEGRGSFWFDRLSSSLKDAVIDHALSVIASQTEYLERVQDGGDNDAYYKLMQACARSAAPGAEDLWVKYASTAKDADDESKLRAEFERCRQAATRPDGVTLGTLLHYARERGADFEPWKRQASPPFLPPDKRQRLRGGKYTEEEALELINSHYFLGRDGRQIGIFRINDNGSLAFTTPDQLKLDLDNVLVRKGEKYVDGDKFWRKHPQRRQCKIVFRLGGSAEPGEYNLWRGFAVEPRRGWQKQRRLLRHILKIVCRRDKDKFKYLMRWLAFLVQRPEQLPGTVIVLKSRREGTGKSTIGAVMLIIFGPYHSALVDDKDRIVGRFNDWLEPMCFILAEEILWAGDRKSTDKLKSRITAPQMPMERKNGAIWQADNHLHCIMTTNHEHAVAAGVGDRRNVVYDVSPEHANDKSWFGPLYRDLEDGGASEFLWFLQNLQLGDWHPRQIIKTAEATEQQRMSADTVSEWSQACIDADAIVGAPAPAPSYDLGQPVSSKDLAEAYTGYCKQHGLRAVGGQVFGSACAQMFGPRKKVPAANLNRRPNGYHVPDGTTWQGKVDVRLGIK